MTAATPSQPPRLFTYDFTVLALAATFGFCNIAIFYGFASYLERLGIDPAWRGLLLGAEPLAAFCLRPFLSVLVTPRNALTVARSSLVGLGAALCCYPLARGLGPILAVRLFHGVSFVCLVSAVTALLAHSIPKGQAGRAFGYFSLSALVPYAVMPPLTEWLLPRLGREDRAYAACSLLVLPALALLAPLGRRLGSRAMAGIPGTGRPSLADVRHTLALAPVRLILAANLCLFMSTTLVFFFIKPFAVGLGLADPGLFFTVSTTASLVVRVLAGPFSTVRPAAQGSRAHGRPVLPRRLHGGIRHGGPEPSARPGRGLRPVPGRGPAADKRRHVRPLPASHARDRPEPDAVHDGHGLRGRSGGGRRDPGRRGRLSDAVSGLLRLRGRGGTTRGTACGRRLAALAAGDRQGLSPRNTPSRTRPKACPPLRTNPFRARR